jgi:hypothetical protein
VDAAFSPSGLIEEIAGLLAEGDFEGAEEVLTGALTSAPSRYESFFHYQLGRIYVKWNKMTSAMNHLSRAAELAHSAGDEFFLLQVSEELRAARAKQEAQKP